MEFSGDPFKESFQRFQRTAVRYEAQREYPRGPDEEADFQRFLAGASVAPTEYAWMQPWVSNLRAWRLAGKEVSRVRVVDDPVTDYQRWLLWGHPWMSAAGERILYLTRSAARDASLPWHDWWMYDGQWVTETWYSRKGKAFSRMVITDPESVARYGAWWDIALRFATTVDRVAA